MGDTEQAEIAHLLTVAGPLEQTIAASPQATIRPRASTAGARARQAVEALASDERNAAEVGVDLDETLGEGGMGIVRLGTQRSMGRQVAVKTARSDRRGEATTLKILREAWVTGALEHPNVLPVYDVGVDDDGSPIIVMRLVDGTDWAQLIHDTAAVRERFGADELLEWNLGVFMQVCNAVRYAHSRGIIHRDLKPENVMIGTFGEVYLLDWGIAVSLEGDGDGRFPVAKDTDEMIGTPAYMAPEMLAGEGHKLSERTDIYLLGAILHEIIEGRPPHACKNVEAFVNSVVASAPNFRRTVPEELERICRTAMHKQVDARYANVEELRLAVQHFLHHRGSIRLADEALETLDQMRDAVASSSETSDEDRIKVHRLFAQCRFAFQEALAQWNENKPAHEGLQRALVVMARFELSIGDHRAAALRLSDVDQPPPDLVQALEAAKSASAAEQEEMEHLRHLRRQHDRRYGQRTRWFGIGIMGLTWVALPIFVAGRPQPTHEELFVFPAGLLAISIGIVIWARESLLKTAFNRKAVGSIMFSFVAQAVLVLGCLIGDVATDIVLPMEIFMWWVVGSMITLTLERRFWPAALGYLAAFLAVAWLRANDPDYLRSALYVVAAANAWLTATVLVIWRPKTLLRTEDEITSG